MTKTPPKKLSALVKDSIYTGVQIAGKLGYRPASWRMICTGLRRLPNRHRPKLAKILGVSLAVVQRACVATYRGDAPKAAS